MGMSAIAAPGWLTIFAASKGLPFSGPKEYRKLIFYPL